MKHNLILFFALIIALASCSSEETGPASVITINGETKNLSYGKIQDRETDLTANVPFRNYRIGLSDLSTSPSNYIEFSINSPNTSRLNEGTYPYAYFPEAGEFTSIYVTSNMKYDSKGVAISGTVLTENDIDDDFDNKIIVSKSGDNKKFEFSLRFVKNGTPYEVSGSYARSLTEGYVYH